MKTVFDIYKAGFDRCVGQLTLRSDENGKDILEALREADCLVESARKAHVVWCNENFRVYDKPETPNRCLLTAQRVDTQAAFNPSKAVHALGRAKQILQTLPGVKVQVAGTLKNLRHRRDYDNDFVLVGLKLPSAGNKKSLPVSQNVVQVFVEARRAVHPEYLQILVKHDNRIWVFDKGHLQDITE